MNHLSLQKMQSVKNAYIWYIDEKLNNINGEHEVTCLLVVISAATLLISTVVSWYFYQTVNSRLMGVIQRSCMEKKNNH